MGLIDSLKILTLSILDLDCLFSALIRSFPAIVLTGSTSKKAEEQAFSMEAFVQKIVLKIVLAIERSLND